MKKPWRYTLIAVMFLACVWLTIQSYYAFGGKGVFSEILALIAMMSFGMARLRSFCVRAWKKLAISAGARTFVAAAPDGGASTSRLNWDLFFVSAIFFFGLYPFSIFLHAVGLGPGLAFILAFAYLFSTFSFERSIHTIIAIIILTLFLWLWGEAGKEGLVVMPVDLPEGRDDMNFTADGVANALETELKDFGSNETDYGGSEASIIFSKDLEDKLLQNPWYKGSQDRPPLLEGLHATHVIIGTDVEGFPLINIYHILRHLRGMPLLEAQILLGDDDSLTLALRRSNAPLSCMDDSLSDSIPRMRDVTATGDAAVKELWDATAQQRTSFPDIPDTRGCKHNALRWLLSWLDIATLPSAAEERLANVTVHHLQGDERLTAALHLAALQAMKQLSPERLAVFYDNNGKGGSSLYYYQKAIPSLLQEAHGADPSLAEYARQRLASALVRIGDFQGQCPAADDAYNLAIAVVPDDLNVQARIGYGYLVRAKELEWKKIWGTNQTQPVCSEGSPLEFEELIDKAIDHLKEAISDAGRVQRTWPSFWRTRNIALMRLGLTRKVQQLTWAESNLSYALTLRSDAGISPGNNQREAAGYSAQAIKAIEEFGPGHPTDPRPYIVEIYIKALDVRSENSRSLNCGVVLEKLRKIDPIPTDTAPRMNYYALATRHNSLLMEDQLLKSYMILVDKCPEFQERAYKLSYHELLFRSLLALVYLERGAKSPDKPIKGLDKSMQYQLERASETLQKAAPEKNDEMKRTMLTLKRHQKDRDLHLALEQLFVVDNSGDKSQVGDAMSHLCNLPAEPTPDSARLRSICAKIRFSARGGKDQVTEAERAVNAIPSDYFLCANLGIIQIQSGKDDAALSTFQRAVQLNPREPQLRYLLSFALYQNGHAEEAREQSTYGQMLDPIGWDRGRYFRGLSLSLNTSASPFTPSVAAFGKTANAVTSSSGHGPRLRPARR